MIIGVDLGGTKLRVAAVSREGVLLCEPTTMSTPAASGPEAVLEAIATAVDQVAARHGKQVSTVGVAATGVIDSLSGIVLSATQAMKDWAGTNVRDGLKRHFESRALRPPRIAVMNDVDACAEAELWVGAAKGMSSALVVAAGTGIGGAIVVDGVVQHGAHNAAGEIGHIPLPGAAGAPCPCGLYGHVEAVASGKAVERLYRQATGRCLTGPAISEAAALGDVQASDCLATAGKALGTALAGVVTTLDPELVVLTGGLAQAGEGWVDAVRGALRRQLVPHLREIPVVVSVLGGAGPVIGAVRSLVGYRGDSL